ncbi:hypothetical protein CFT61_16415 [Segatella copri]|uniref:Uncharacterized protein n=1 Tax=Segatella copri TaxID=165179 RepID=A0AA91TGM2_9BACT|nr:hypothetical protein CFT61_16415 [Segatella copri]
MVLSEELVQEVGLALCKIKLAHKENAMHTNPKQFTQQTDIPEGYWIDADQKLTRVDLVKPLIYSVIR